MNGTGELGTQRGKGRNEGTRQGTHSARTPVRMVIRNSVRGATTIEFKRASIPQLLELGDVEAVHVVGVRVEPLGEREGRVEVLAAEPAQSVPTGTCRGW